MDFFRLRYYLEILSIATGVVLLICVLPIQALVDGKIRLMTITCGAILWYTIIFYNTVFRHLIEKWFKR